MRRERLNGAGEALLARYGLAGVAAEAACLLHHAPGELVCAEGETMKWLLLVVSGRVRVCYLSPGGRSMPHCFYDGGGMLGEIELLMGHFQATTTIEAVTALTCVGVPMNCAQAQLTNNAFLRCMAVELAEKLDQSGRRSAEATLFPLRARLCVYISHMQVDGRFAQRLTTLAELLGVSYRHLLRTLEALCQEGVLARERGGFRVLDWAALEGDAL